MIKVYYVILLIIIGLVNCTCASSTGSPKTLVPAQQAQRPNYILIGTIIELNSARAFILIPARNNEEKIYKIGDKLDEWEIIKIISDEVKLKNNKSEIMSLRIKKAWTNPIFEGGSPISDSLSAENILFTTSVNADNSPISPTMCFKSSDCQIYACFTNQGILSGLSKLVHRWTNKSTGEIIRLATSLIDPNAPFNFIWVRKTDGWQVGEYEVEFFKAQTLEKVAEGKFTIVAEENKKEDVKDKSGKSEESDKPNK